MEENEEEQEGKEEGEKITWVGYIYVHGIMDGETLAKDRNGTEARLEEGVGPKETQL